MRYVALLRAINVGGHTVKMDRLRGIFEAAGMSDVATFIASGNVIFESRAKAPSLEKKLQVALEAALGYAVAAFIRTPAELAVAGAHKEIDGALYVGFCHAVIDAAAKQKLIALQTATDTFEVKGREFYWLAKAGMGQSKITGAQLERALGMPTTMRNITTVRNLAEKFAVAS
jgi:uncharacterized protein (DUF1697 family)